MYLRAGAISLALLLASRVLGLLRESVQAAAFGTTATADLAVLMLTLPDLASAVFASGALAYALLPLWARQAPQELRRSQGRAARILLGLGLAIALVLALAPQAAGRWLAPGLGAAAQPRLVEAIWWAALAVPLALLGSLWYTRLQHERDVVGMYGMNVVHTGVVIAALATVGWGSPGGQGDSAIRWLGAGLLLALALRLLFLHWRLPGPVQAEVPATAGPAGLPGWRIWLWAALATGAPVAMLLVARSLVSRNGEGALAAFNYAWKLVELPNLLAIQLVATLAFPALTRAHAQGRDFSVQLRAAFLLAWTLACAAALGLWLAARPLADLLFGWGRMDPQRVAEVADWAAWGGWTLLPQALVTVTILVLATRERMRVAALAYAGALALVLLAGLAGLHAGRDVMLALLGVFAALAAVLLWLAGAETLAALPWRQMAVPALLAAVLAPAGALVPASQPSWLLGVACVAALALLGLSYAASPALRAALKR
jgi:peptidoglycan biosynthesis protein MviN/MurJ (putative lipid II flippase)